MSNLYITNSPTNIMKENTKTIVLGKTDNSVFTAKLDVENEQITFDEYVNVFDYAEGEQKARDMLESEGEYFWKEAVAADRTTKGLEEYREEILSIDGWETTIGEDSFKEIGYSGYYAEEINEDIDLTYDEAKYIDYLVIEPEDYNIIAKGYDEENKDKLISIFAKYKESDGDRIWEAW